MIKSLFWNRWSITVTLFLSLTVGGVTAFWWICVRLPPTRMTPRLTATTWQAGQLRPDWEDSIILADPDQTKDSEDFLKEVIHHLAVEIGERNLTHYRQLMKTADYIENRFKRSGYQVEREKFQVNQLDCYNLIVEKKGEKLADEILLVGAHYDTALGTPGANDNGSGVAALLYIADQLKDKTFDRTIRLVAFTNEEPPYFQREGQMGSWVHAKNCRQRGDILIGVISLETMGYFSDEPDSQKYPASLAAFYPSTGNFIGFVSDLQSRRFLLQTIKHFQQHCDVPVERASLPATVPGVGWSDHWSFWQEGYVGLMVTDTAPFRYPDYHLASDTPDKIDYGRYSLVVEGISKTVADLATLENMQNEGQ